jgi:hypothetical protein
MAGIGFQHMTPVFDRAKTVYALDCAVTVFVEIAFNTVQLFQKILSFMMNVQRNYLTEYSAAVFQSRVHMLTVTQSVSALQRY